VALRTRLTLSVLQRVHLSNLVIESEGTTKGHYPVRSFSQMRLNIVLTRESLTSGRFKRCLCFPTEM
jgi:hypothetical protein